jgi:hypothetical protein
MKFKNFYINSLARESNDSPYQDTDEWINEHLAYTKNKSLMIGVFDESVYHWQSYIDINVLPIMFNLIKETNKIPVYLSNNTSVEQYILKELNRKFPNKVEYKKIEDKVIKEIKELESQDKLVIYTPDTATAYSIKFLVEYA